VALVAPAGPTPPVQLERAGSLLEGWGLTPVVYPSATALHPRATYLSGADEVRAADLFDAWCDPGIAGIFCLRGGYRTVRLLDRLDVERMRAAGPTQVYGSSDVTALHEWLRERLGVATWFTPMIGTLSLLDDEVAVSSLRAAVLDPFAGQRLRGEGLAVGTARGTLIGGNLSLLAMTLGARDRVVDNTDTIALIEDIGEDTYRIDGYLHALLRSGWFDGVRGVALGSWLDCGPLEEIRALCAEVLEPLGVPVAWELGFGHGVGSQSVPLGVPATFVVDDREVALSVDGDRGGSAPRGADPPPSGRHSPSTV
jgi:muramoyltetrapeptide carboxypeptidase